MTIKEKTNKIIISKRYIKKASPKIVKLLKEKKIIPLKKEVKKTIALVEKKTVSKKLKKLKKVKKKEIKKHTKRSKKIIKKIIVKKVKAKTINQRELKQTKEKVNKKNILIQKQYITSIKNNYLNEIRNKIKENLIYPSIAKRMRMEDTIYVEFTIYLNGNIGNIQVIQWNKSILKKSALHTLNKIIIRNIPKELKIKKLDVKLPIEFKLIKSS